MSGCTLFYCRQLDTYPWLSVIFLLHQFCTFACQTLPGNGPAVTTLPAVLLSSKPPLIQNQTSELKLALEGTSAFTPSQVMGLGSFQYDILILKLHGIPISRLHWLRSVSQWVKILLMSMIHSGLLFQHL